MVDADTECKGDGDPIDVCEVGTMVFVFSFLFIKGVGYTHLFKLRPPWVRLILGWVTICV